jgi:hypothetical protein
MMKVVRGLAFRSACGKLTAGAIRQRPRLNQAAAITGCLPTIANAPDDAACDRRFETMGQRMVLDARDPCRIWDHGHIYLLWRAR